jgi:hypothetical protein
MRSIARVLKRQLTSSRTDRRVLAAVVVFGLAANAYLWRSELAHYGWLIQMKWRERVLPLIHRKASAGCGRSSRPERSTCGMC